MKQSKIFGGSIILRGDDHCSQFDSASTPTERSVRDGSDIGGDDHVGASTALGAVAVMEGRRRSKGCCGSLCGCERAVDDGGGIRKRCRRQVGYRPTNNMNWQSQDAEIYINPSLNWRERKEIERLQLTRVWTLLRWDPLKKRRRRCSPQTLQIEKIPLVYLFLSFNY